MVMSQEMASRMRAGGMGGAEKPKPRFVGEVRKHNPDTLKPRVVERPADPVKAMEAKLTRDFTSDKKAKDKRYDTLLARLKNGEAIVDEGGNLIDEKNDTAAASAVEASEESIAA